MSKVICEREDIVAIADAVRSKGNTTEEMTLGEIETAVYNIKSAGVDKIQRYIESQGNSARYLFYMFKGASVDELMDGVDTSNVVNMGYMFSSCSNIKNVPMLETRNVTNIDEMLGFCSTLTTVPSFDIRNVASAYATFNNCKALTECWIRNIKANIQVGYGSSWGHLLTLENLLHLCKECRKTPLSFKLTVGTANLAKLEGIYVKLIPITDDMRAEDDLIDEKYPFVVCESTDEGAMTIQDYMATKSWTLA